MVAEGIFFRFLPPFVHNVVLDDLVFQNYAAHLLPRAIGYSAGLLDYFFRGRIEIAPPARFAYGLAAYQPGNAGTFTKLRFKVRNATPNEATGSGEMIAVAQYRTALTGANLIDDPNASISSQLFFAVSKPLTAVALTDAFQEFTFDFVDSPIPTNSADLFLTVVYKGRLGLEDEAVMVGGKDLFEPHPVDSINVSDWECLQGTPYHVGDLTAYPPYHPPTQTQRDVNHDHIQDLFGPGFIPRHFLKLFDLAQATPLPSEANFDLRLVDQGPAQYGRRDPPAGPVVVRRRRVRSRHRIHPHRPRADEYVRDRVRCRAFAMTWCWGRTASWSGGCPRLPCIAAWHSRTRSSWRPPAPFRAYPKRSPCHPISPVSRVLCRLNRRIRMKIMALLGGIVAAGLSPFRSARRSHSSTWADRERSRPGGSNSATRSTTRSARARRFRPGDTSWKSVTTASWWSKCARKPRSGAWRNAAPWSMTCSRSISCARICGSCR